MLMMEAEGTTRLHGLSAATCHSLCEGLEGHTLGDFRILNADLKDLLGGEDVSQQHLFVDQQGLGHILYKALSVGQEGGF